MKKYLIAACCILISVYASAQTEKTTNSSDDPLDVSKLVEQIEKYGVPTISAVDEMWTKAKALYDTQDWKGAAEAYEKYAKHANWLANLLAQCVEPYYGASYDDRKNISYTLLKQYIPYETASNKLKGNRNEAYVKMGLCYKHMGDVNRAVTFLHKGLDLLDIEQTTIWSEAASALAEIVGYSAAN